MIRVFSIFTSIQGESTRAGLASGFLRLAGCPLNCSYCDTREACEAEGKPYTIEQLVSESLNLGPKLVEVTGGEPLAQKEVPKLLTALCDSGLEVMVETSGAFPIKGIDSRVRIIMDIKCPGSGMADRMCMENFSYLSIGRHEVKFVVTSKEDFDWAAGFCTRYGLDSGFDVLASPVQGKVDLEELAGWVLKSTVPFRLQPQLHKIIWKGTQIDR